MYLAFPTCEKDPVLYDLPVLATVPMCTAPRFQTPALAWRGFIFLAPVFGTDIPKDTHTYR